MKRNDLLQMVVMAVAVLCVAGVTGLYAGTTVLDVVKMEHKAYTKHTKGIVQFSHKKHAEDYKAGCGDCHHDEKGKPLTSLKAGDDVKNCFDCHSKPGLAPKGKGAPKLSKKEKVQQYHAEAIHANCIDCHKTHNKTTKTKAAPVTCKDCHPKK
ncbi:MAG: cytochrome c3 family protein [Thermodesulfobacteriota bacterium]